MAIKGIYSRTKNVLLLMQFVGDGVCAMLGLLLAYGLRFYTPLKYVGVLHEDMPMADYLPLILIGAIFFVGSMSYLNAYDARNLLRVRRAHLILLKTTAFWLCIFLGVSLVIKFEPGISRVFAFISAITVFGVVFAWRWLFYKWLLRSKYHSRLTQRLLIVGWSSEAEQLVHAINGNEYHPDEVIGYLRSGESADENHRRPCPCLGEIGDLERIIRTHNVNIVAIADLTMPNEEISRNAAICERLYVHFKIMPSFFRIFVSNLRLQTISGVPVLGVEELPTSSMINAGTKRLVDIIGSLVGLAISAPIIAVMAILIKRESPGPVFYKQVRTGRNGRPFYIYKLRSMKLDAETQGAQWAVADDPRRLKIGTFMRSTNIDELPQFWNVLKGDMSLVGPRPERPELIKKFEHEIPHYNPRHYVRPGITGWAQVNGLRGNTSLTERINYDLYYIENWTLWFDIQIMVMTLGPQKNAY